MNKEYPVTDEMKELMFDYLVGIKCRDQCINSVFKSKRAIKYGKDAEKARFKFWNLFRELYPEVSSEHVNYDFHTQIASIIQDED